VDAWRASDQSYSVAARVEHVEIRQYGARFAAEMVVDGDAETTRSFAYRRLADYLAGANKGGATIPMTEPMLQAAEGPTRWRIRFFMPANATLATLPQPADPAISLVAVPPETLAVLRFSGAPDASAVALRTGLLITALEGSAWRPAGAPVALFYDPPWSLPPLRRNEVAIPVSPR
jgi:hypothetical protein